MKTLSLEKIFDWSDIEDDCPKLNEILNNVREIVLELDSTDVDLRNEMTKLGFPQDQVKFRIVEDNEEQMTNIMTISEQ